mgnify:CR=1 FL=1
MKPSDVFRPSNFDALVHEYGLDGRRLLPWDRYPMPFAGGWCVVRPHTESAPHSQIDHIWIDRSLRVLDARVGDDVGSDHRPVRELMAAVREDLNRLGREVVLDLVPPPLERTFSGPRWLGEKVKHVIEPRVGDEPEALQTPARRGLRLAQAPTSCASCVKAAGVRRRGRIWRRLYPSSPRSG